ncbi:MAG TPA: DNA gyrase inhibitor YacG [Kofleriaceae bacterium]
MRCPTCRAPVARDTARPNKLFPFCSERCHLVDLGRWLGEDYRIPGPPVAAEGLVQLPDED